MASRSQRRRRMTDLFMVGAVLQVAPGEVVWIKKLNQFEDGEARQDAMAARSRFTLTLRADDSPQTASLRETVKRMDKDRLVEGIIASRYTRYMAEASTALHADPNWAERLNVLDRTDIEDTRLDEAETINRINSEYLADLQARVREREQADREKLTNDDDEEVQTQYEESFIDSRAAAVYIGEYKLGQLAWAVRMCDATPPSGDDADWDHLGCTHERLYVDEEVPTDDGGTRTKRAIEFVREEPDELLDIYTRAFDNLHVPGALTKGSASRQSSSEPSRPQSEQEDSAASTQEVTSSEPVATSV